MRYSSSLRTTILAATIAIIGMSAHAGPMPTHIATIKSMNHQTATEVRWRSGGWDYPVYGYPFVSSYYYDGGYGYDYGDSYCSRPLATRPAIKVQNRYLGTDPDKRLPWTD